MTRTGLLIKLSLLGLTVGYDVFCNDIFDCHQVNVLGEAQYRYNPMFLNSRVNHQIPDGDSSSRGKRVSEGEEIIKARNVRWTRLKREQSPWGRLKREPSWMRLKKDEDKSGLESGWVRMMRSPRLLDKFGRIL